MRYGSSVEGVGTRAVRNFLDGVTAETAGHRVDIASMITNPGQTNLHPQTPTPSRPRTRV